MGQVISISGAPAPAPASEAAPAPAPLSGRRLAVAQERLAAITPLMHAITYGAPKMEAIATWCARTGYSPATARRWLDAHDAGGLVALAPETRGRQRKDYGWEGRAARLYAQPQRPAYNTVAYWLREEGHASATNSRVRRYLKSLPSNYAETSRKRLGAHYYAQNVRPHVVRDASVLNVGECFEGDGHTCDVYVAHPATGNPFRPELTTWIDIRSQRVVGWWLGEMENSFDVLYALSSAIRAHDHVPTLLHTDPGSGFVNKMLSDEAVGFYARLDITPIPTLPGNARGKGLQEGWFRWYEERLGKRFPTFCGHCRTDDALARLRQRIRRGDIALPSFAQYRDAVAAHMLAYNAQPKDGLGGKSPDELWEALAQNPLHLPVVALYRPHKPGVAVRNWEVRLFNRRYRSAQLAQYERRKVTVEYDIHDDRRVWIRDGKGQLVGEAALVEKKPWIEPSVLADRRRRAAEGQRKRLRQHLAEVDARARQPVTAAALVDALEGPAELPSAGTAPALTEHDALNTPPRRAQTPAPRAVSREAERLAAELDAPEAVTETPEQRFMRACALEAAAEIDAADAKWLAIYRTSPEYAAHRLLAEE